MKKRAFAVMLLIYLSFIPCSVLNAEPVSDDRIVTLVEQVAREISADAQSTFDKINSGLPPYSDNENTAFYVFVYDTDVNIAAHPKKKLVGKNFKGIPDVRGKKFRDKIVSGALKNKTGWINYVYEKPDTKQIRAKKTYYKLSTGSDGKKYVVCSGKYRSVNRDRLKK